jgi:uncharacterized protein (DUF2147 family)
MRSRLFLAAVLVVAAAAVAAAQQGVTGFWQTIDDETGRARSVVAVYAYDGKVYARVILAYDDDGVTVRDDISRQQRRSPFLEGTPPFCGLDIIWDLAPDKGGRYKGGSVMDPGSQEKKPKIYGAEMWRDGDSLIVRGKIAFFGRNQTWKPFGPSAFPAGFTVPDPGAFRPVIPRIK